MLSGIRFGAKKPDAASSAKTQENPANSTAPQTNSEANAPKAPAKREDWMMSADFHDPLEDARRQAAAEAEAHNRARSRPNEVLLGSTSLPGAPKEGGLWRPKAAAPESEPSTTPAVPKIGDGGLSWRNRISLSKNKGEIDGVYAGVKEKHERRAEKESGKDGARKEGGRHGERDGRGDRSGRDDRGGRDSERDSRLSDRYRDRGSGRRDADRGEGDGKALNIVAPSAELFAKHQEQRDKQRRAEMGREKEREKSEEELQRARELRDREIMMKRAQMAEQMAEDARMTDESVSGTGIESTSRPAEFGSPDFKFPEDSEIEALMPQMESLDVMKADLRKLSVAEIYALKRLYEEKSGKAARDRERASAGPGAPEKINEELPSEYKDILIKIYRTIKYKRSAATAKSFEHTISLAKESERERAMREVTGGVYVDVARDKERRGKEKDKDDVEGKERSDSLKALLLEAKQYDPNAFAAKSIMRNAHYKEMSLDDQDEEYDNLAKMKKNEEKDMERMEKMEVNARKRQETQENQCKYCLHNIIANRVVCMGKFNYIYVPSLALCDGHVVIAPREHVMSQMHAEEHIFGEMVMMKKMLCQAYRDRKMAVMFLEVCVHKDQRSGGDRQTSGYNTGTLSGAGNGHCLIHAIPINVSSFLMMPAMVKKEIEDCIEGQNKNIINLALRGLRHSLPKSSSLSYVAIEFGMDIADLANPKTAGTQGKYGYICTSTTEKPKNAGKNSQSSSGSTKIAFGGWGERAYDMDMQHDLLVGHYQEKVVLEDACDVIVPMSGREIAKKTIGMDMLDYTSQDDRNAKKAADAKKIAQLGGGEYELLGDDGYDMDADLRSLQQETKKKEEQEKEEIRKNIIPDKCPPGYARIIDTPDFPLDLVMSTCATAIGVDALAMRMRKDKKTLAEMATRVRRWVQRYEYLVSETRDTAVSHATEQRRDSDRRRDEEDQVQTSEPHVDSHSNHTEDLTRASASAEETASSTVAAPAPSVDKRARSKERDSERRGDRDSRHKDHRDRHGSRDKDKRDRSRDRDRDRSRDRDRDRGRDRDGERDRSHRHRDHSDRDRDRERRRD